MRFCPWYGLDEVDRHAPPTRGVFQVRVPTGLLAYPTGQSAMVHYELADDLRAAGSAFAARFAGRGWLCRHTIEMSSADEAGLDAFWERLLRDFRVRFGASPRLPEEVAA
jgi:hypothetical protein